MIIADAQSADIGLVGLTVADRQASSRKPPQADWRENLKALYYCSFCYTEPRVIRRNQPHFHVVVVERPAHRRIVPRDTLSKFEKLASEWRESTKYLSSVTSIAMDPSYQQIIGMGDDVVPLLLRELRNQEEPDYWFWALRAITGADPVPAADKGNVCAMADAWTKWGKSRGYLR